MTEEKTEMVYETIDRYVKMRDDLNEEKEKNIDSWDEDDEYFHDQKVLMISEFIRDLKRLEPND